VLEKVALAHCPCPWRPGPQESGTGLRVLQVMAVFLYLAHRAPWLAADGSQAVSGHPHDLPGVICLGTDPPYVPLHGPKLRGKASPCHLSPLCPSCLQCL
jgi:hypothetical protein